jgi:hypothetical protein
VKVVGQGTRHKEEAWSALEEHQACRAGPAGETYAFHWTIGRDASRAYRALLAPYLATWAIQRDGVNRK